MHNSVVKFIRISFATSDLVLLNMCFLLSFKYFYKYEGLTNISQSFTFFLLINISWILSALLFRLYHEYTIYKVKDVHKATWRTLALHGIIIFLVLVLNKFDVLTIKLFLSFYLLYILSLIISRFAYISIENLLKSSIENRSASIMAIASIGGHWIELLRFMPVFNINNVTFISTKANVSDTIMGYKFYSIPDANRNNKFDLVKCGLSVIWCVIKSRPQVIITTGAAPGLIGILAGKIFGSKTIWVDSIANVEELSMSGHLATKIADRVYTQWQHLETPKVLFSGNIF